MLTESDQEPVGAGHEVDAAAPVTVATGDDVTPSVVRRRLDCSSVPEQARWWWVPSAREATGWALLALPMLLWLAALWPGVMTNDSIDMLGQAINGPVVDWHPPVLTLVLGLSWTIAGSPVLLVIAQVVAIAWAVRRVLDVSIIVGVRPILAYGFGVFVCALPPVGAFAVHVWKDVAFTVGFLLVVEWVLRLTLHRLGSLDRMPGVAGVVRLSVGLSLVLLLRPNGVVLVAFLTVFTAALVRTAWRAAAAALGIAVGVFALVTLVIYPASGVLPPPSASASGLATFDLSAVAQHSPGSLDRDVAESLETMAPIKEFEKGYNCHWAAPSKFRRDLQPTAETDFRALSRGWREALLRNPALLVGNHLCAAYGIWNPFPAPEERAHYETLYDGIIPNQFGLRSDPLSDRFGAMMKDLLVAAGRGTVYQVLLWRSATWVWAVTLIFAAAALRRRRWWCLVPVLPLVAHGLSVIAMFGPHYRYGAPSWIAAVMMVPTALALALHRDPGGSTAAVGEISQ